MGFGYTVKDEPPREGRKNFKYHGVYYFNSGNNDDGG